jgi:hypothetical protein
LAGLFDQMPVQEPLEKACSALHPSDRNSG